MEKIRDYKYDNLKFIMIFFVVFAHFLEMAQGEIINKLYIFIYTFHMPIFVYISGYFSKGSNKNIKKFIYTYLIWQTIDYLFRKFILKAQVEYSIIYPSWTLWYMMAMIIWNITIKFLNNFFYEFLNKNYWVCLIISFTISILVGFIDEIGYEWSLSRIITFSPYFLLGYFNKNFNLRFLELNGNDKNTKYKKIIITILAVISIVYFIVNINLIKGIWLYGSYSYNIGGYNYVFKTIWIILSIVELFFFYNITTGKKIKIISNIGANTLSVYLLHAIILVGLKKYSPNIFCYTEMVNITIMLIFTWILLITLGSEFTRKRMLYLTDFNAIKEKFILKGEKNARKN